MSLFSPNPPIRPSQLRMVPQKDFIDSRDGSIRTVAGSARTGSRTRWFAGNKPGPVMTTPRQAKAGQVFAPVMWRCFFSVR